MPIVREGTWLYANKTPVRVRILSSPGTWGTGDRKDDETLSEDRPIPCFFLAWEMAGAPGRFPNIAPNLMSLELAVAYAEKQFPGIRWQDA